MVDETREWQKVVMANRIVERECCAEIADECAKRASSGEAREVAEIIAQAIRARAKLDPPRGGEGWPT